MANPSVAHWTSPARLPILHLGIITVGGEDWGETRGYLIVTDCPSITVRFWGLSMKC